ncbi:MAG: LPS assembly lipoprotein LptE [Thermaurantiacus sp.]
MPDARLLLLVPAFWLGACALEPVYSAGQSGPAATMLGGIAVDPIPDRNGFLVRDRLLARLNSGATTDGPQYRLRVRLDDRIDGFGVRGDNSIIRERRTLRARWQLFEDGSETPILDATAGADAGIDVVGSEFAVVAAETSAAERLADEVAAQIIARIALHARQAGR